MQSKLTFADFFIETCPPTCRDLPRRALARRAGAGTVGWSLQRDRNNIPVRKNNWILPKNYQM